MKIEILEAPDIGAWVEELYEQDRNFATIQLAQWFAYEHLRDPVAKQASASVAALAVTLVHDLTDGPELSAGLRKLLEAKDCFVRQAMTAVASR